MCINIRKASVSDYEQINNLFWQSDLYHYRNEPYIYEKSNEHDRNKEYIESLINDKASIFLVLEIENKIIGFLYAYEETKGGLPFHKKRKYIVIDNIVVDENYQNKGYGKKLLDYIIKYAKDGNYNDIELYVYCFNKKAIKLYEKNGFENLTQNMILKL